VHHLNVNPALVEGLNAIRTEDLSAAPAAIALEGCPFEDVSNLRDPAMGVNVHYFDALAGHSHLAPACGSRGLTLRRSQDGFHGGPGTARYEHAG
jgi:hypothetical protein